MDYRDFVDSRNLKHYLEQIAKFPTSTEAEEKALGEKIRQGDEAALRRLLEANLKFVVSYVKKYRGMGLSMLDLINEGNVGLIEAARRFDPGRNVRFISYAVWWIRQAIIHALSQYSHIYNIPQKLSDQISLMKKRKAQLKTELGREPNREEVAAAMGITDVDIEDLELLEGRNLSLSDKFHDEDLEIEDRISDQDAQPVEYQVIQSSVQQQIRDMLG
jgi:RNA polymerase primary sigma factor